MSRLGEPGVDLRRLDELPPRERRVLELRLGLAGEEPTSVEDVAALFAVTPARVREIEARAAGRLGAGEEEGWEEATDTLDLYHQHFLTIAGLELVIYARRPDPERPGVVVAYLCPPLPVGYKLEVRTRPGEPPLWRHARLKEDDDGRASVPPDATRA